jgi:type II secretory pathway pseudopilin PulG
MNKIINKRIVSSKGMTMVELLVAVLVLTIGVIAIAGVVPMAMRSITKNRVITRAVEYTQQEMETLKRLGFDNLDTVSTDLFNPSGDSRYVTWVNVADSIGGVGNIKMVTVTTSMRPEVDTASLKSNDVISMTSYFTR